MAVDTHEHEDGVPLLKQRSEHHGLNDNESYSSSRQK